jgi:hypothetical protein
MISATLYLAGSLAIITGMKGGSMILTSKYPKVSCPMIIKQFDAKLQEYAFYEYEGFYAKSKQTDMTGVLQCFCENSDPSWDMFSKEYKPFPGSDSSEPICASWYLETQTLKPIISTTVQYTIIFINNILRSLLVAQITTVGFPTNSLLSKFIKNYVFAVQFINTALIVLILNANLEDFGMGWLLSGKYKDFSPTWY